MTDEQLDAIEQSIQALTEGPWTALRNADKSDMVAATVLDHRGVAQAVTYNWPNGPGWEQALANACFIANARRYVPALVAEVRRQRQRIAELEQQERDRDAELVGLRAGEVREGAE